MNAEPLMIAETPALLLRTPASRWLFLFAHGAGAGMRHAFMHDLSVALAARDMATLRYEFPYMSSGSKRPDRAPVLERVVRVVAEHAAETFSGLRLVAGGKSMGGRMTSRAQSAAPLPRVEGLAFTGFPLHPAGVPATERADHLDQVAVPMLFMQGTRDALADSALMRTVAARLQPRAVLHEIAGADHGFAVLKRSGRTREEVIDELADTLVAWTARLPT